MTRWTGPRETDLAADGVTLLRPVPPERWPFGEPDAHQDCCSLHAGRLYCDCEASDEGADDEPLTTAAPTPAALAPSRPRP